VKIEDSSTDMATAAADDDDLKALRAASWALKELKRVIPLYIPKIESDAERKEVSTLSMNESKTITELVHHSPWTTTNIVRS